MSALDGIKARLAAQKAAAAQTASGNATPTPAQEQQTSVPSLGEMAPGASSESTVHYKSLDGRGDHKAGPNVQSEVTFGGTGNIGHTGAAVQANSNPVGTAAAVDPRLAGLSGVQLLIARKKLAEEAAKAGKGAKPNASAGSHSGVATGTGSSVATEVTKPQLAQAVLTPAQRAMEEAKSILQRKEGEGFYNIPPANAARLPQDLPADVVSERLRELDAALVLRTPDLARLTIEINRNLRQYDELAYLLQDEQLGLIVQANLTIKNTELIATKAKGSSVANRNAKIAASLTADDI